MLEEIAGSRTRRTTSSSSCTRDDAVADAPVRLLDPRHAANRRRRSAADDLAALHQTRLLSAATSWSPRRATSTTTSCSTVLEREGWFEGDAPSRRARPVAPAPAVPRAPSAHEERDTRADPHRLRHRHVPAWRPAALRARAPARTSFGGGMSSRLFQRVREELGLAYAVFAYPALLPDGRACTASTSAPSRRRRTRRSRRSAPSYARLAARGPARRRAGDGQAAAQGPDHALAGEPGRADVPAGRLRAVRRAVPPARRDAGRDRRGHAEEVAAVAAEFFAPERQTVVRLGPRRRVESRTQRRDLPPRSAHSNHSRTPMMIGVPKEIKTNENRIALVPAGAEALVAAGTRCFVETGAGLGSGFPDEAYTAVGATIARRRPTRSGSEAEMIMKVKEPIAVEWPRMREGPGDLHLLPLRRRRGADPGASSTRGAIASPTRRWSCPSGELPLLTPMSEVAGRMAVQEGAKYLEKLYGGRGVLLGGVPGVAPGEVVILGGGVVGINAAKMAAGLGAHVDDPGHLARPAALPRRRDAGERAIPIYSNRHNILEQIAPADLVVGARADPGRQGAAAGHARRPEAHEAGRRSSWTWRWTRAAASRRSSRRPTRTRPTSSTASSTTRVANMPGGVPRTSTLALTNATLPYATEAGQEGLACRVQGRPGAALGLNVVEGKVVYPGVAEAFRLPLTDVACGPVTEVADLITRLPHADGPARCPAWPRRAPPGTTSPARRTAALAPLERQAVPHRLRHRGAGRVRVPDPAPVRSGAPARDHASQHPGHDRQRLPGRARWSRWSTSAPSRSRSPAACGSPRWSSRGSSG